MGADEELGALKSTEENAKSKVWLRGKALPGHVPSSKLSPSSSSFPSSSPALPLHFIAPQPPHSLAPFLPSLPSPSNSLP